MKNSPLKKNRPNLGKLAPLVLPVFKPPRLGSFDAVRHFKRFLPYDYGKIGHFGTLDPFASGLLLIGVGGAARLNDLVHSELPKTYIAVGKLGVETATGDWEGEIRQKDETPYFFGTIGRFQLSFLKEILEKKFQGEYWQSPHAYSAAKFMGRPLHEWAREGTEIKKEAVKRYIHSVEILKYQFPYVSFKAVVSSGTYVRTLFSDMAQELGTIGSLIALHRSSIGPVQARMAAIKKNWPGQGGDYHLNALRPQDLLPFPQLRLSVESQKKFLNGHAPHLADHETGYRWCMNETGDLLGLIQKNPSSHTQTVINWSNSLSNQDGP